MSLTADDCWCRTRNSEGQMVPDPKTFPSGIKALAEYIHEKGLKLGIYSDAGVMSLGAETELGSMHAECQQVPPTLRASSPRWGVCISCVRGGGRFPGRVGNGRVLGWPDESLNSPDKGWLASGRRNGADACWMFGMYDIYCEGHDESGESEWVGRLGSCRLGNTRHHCRMS
ncbi:unnamed protein product [Prunus armeniaca]|uniref:Alpha-galactosidase n=1 Tax=Prunus armeniaca TaxID=36596 RepID=A0A6J5UDY7_PRUAR|nr:unnamed protein product [Prunus armeniaca]